MNVVKYQNINTTVGCNAEKLLTIKNFICNEFIYGGHLLSLAASSIALSTMILLDIMIRWDFLPIVYLGTLCIYNYDHYRELEIDSANNFSRTNHLKRYQKYLPLIITIYVVAFFVLLFYFGTIEGIFFGGILLFSGLVYTSKVKALTKKIAGFKNFYTSFSFALMILFTAIYCSYALNWVLFFIVAFIFLRFIVETSFFDIKDMETDKKQNLLTLPLYFGKHKFLNLIHIINLVSYGFLIIAIVMGIAPLFSLFLIFFCIYCFYYIQKAKKSDANIQSLSSIIVDGEQILWPVFLFIGKTVITAL